MEDLKNIIKIVGCLVGGLLFFYFYFFILFNSVSLLPFWNKTVTYIIIFYLSDCKQKSKFVEQGIIILFCRLKIV